MPKFVPITKEDILRDKKKSYIRAYVTNFAASWDFAHYDLQQGVVVIACDIEVAHRLAAQSWEDIGCTLP